MQVIESKENFVKNNREIFTSIGKFPDKVSIKLKENAIPETCPPRKVPYRIVNILKDALNKMCAMQIIKNIMSRVNDKVL